MEGITLKLFLDFSHQEYIVKIVLSSWDKELEYINLIGLLEILTIGLSRHFPL